jgi:ribose 5-phosphate isomerase B
MDSEKAIIIGSDNTGWSLKGRLKNELDKQSINYRDVGADTGDESEDYPVFALRVAGAVSSGVTQQGIYICGTGLGTSIIANRFPRVRAALCINLSMAQTARAKNNSNLLVLAAKYTPEVHAVDILDAWLNTSFEGGRHLKRLELIEADRLKIALDHLKLVNLRKLKAQNDSVPLMSRAIYGLEKLHKKLLRKERRDLNQVRVSESCPATLYYKGTDFITVMVDISEKGAQFKFQHTNSIPLFTREDEIKLSIKTCFGPSECGGKVCWYKPDNRTIGMRFSPQYRESGNAFRLFLDSML